MAFANIYLESWLTACLTNMFLVHQQDASPRRASDSGIKHNGFRIVDAFYSIETISIPRPQQEGLIACNVRRRGPHHRELQDGLWITDSAIYDAELGASSKTYDENTLINRHMLSRVRVTVILIVIAMEVKGTGWEAEILIMPAFRG